MVLELVGLVLDLDLEMGQELEALALDPMHQACEMYQLEGLVHPRRVLQDSFRHYRDLLHQTQLDNTTPRAHGKAYYHTRLRIPS